MDTMMALSVDTAETSNTDFDDLYGRYSTALLAAAAEQLAAISPAATDLDEELADQVWDAVEAGHYPDGHRGLDGLLVLLRQLVRRVRARAAAATQAIRSVVIDLDLLADADTRTIATTPALPATVSAAVRYLALAG
ncbi:hypothetical protein ACWCYY_35065 [Kitasatospora sp. NPDC001664]